jgi:hypothetical protein
MKRKLLFFGIFLATLFIGFFVVLFFNVNLVEEEWKIVRPGDVINNGTFRMPEPPKVFDVDVETYYPKMNTGVDLIETGEGLRLDEVNAKTGERWLGLFNENGRTFLRSATVMVRSKPDEWATISIKGKSKPRFLLKNAKNIKEGKATTIFSAPSTFDEDESETKLSVMYPGFIKDLQLGEKKYTLRTVEGINKENDKVLILTLDFDGKSQIISLIHYYEQGDYVGQLLWAGDIDKDGKLDFYMEFYNYEKGGYSSGLFLSSASDDGHLVKMIAGFSTMGC